MKKLLIFSNILTLAVMMFMSCQKSNVGESYSPGSQSAKTGGSYATVNRDCPDCYDHTNTPFEGVNAGTAWQISNNYKLYNLPQLEIDGVGQDANSIWFSLESLKNFIWQLEEEVCKRRCDKGMSLGVRVYYARYPEVLTNDLADLDPAFAQRHTLFMVPTFQDEANSQVHWDFDPWHWGTDPCTPKPMSDWFRLGNKPFGDENSLIFSIDESQYFMTGGGVLSAAMNHGDLVPPYPSQGTGY
ncbi:MAG TPA: hypothetical protein DCQ34_01800 [Chitinophagaceae bacterium]|nr:hypothetical protein [Chitinophagaceae bacterium]HRF26186.1 hypothetical protein [Ferruginibacter sp.]